MRCVNIYEMSKIQNIIIRLYFRWSVKLLARAMYNIMYIDYYTHKE